VFARRARAAALSGMLHKVCHIHPRHFAVAGVLERGSAVGVLLGLAPVPTVDSKDAEDGLLGRSPACIAEFWRPFKSCPTQRPLRRGATLDVHACGGPRSDAAPETGLRRV
jgi:hypothetical protein